MRILIIIILLSGCTANMCRTDNKYMDKQYSQQRLKEYKGGNVKQPKGNAKINILDFKKKNKKVEIVPYV